MKYLTHWNIDLFQEENQETKTKLETFGKTKIVPPSPLNSWKYPGK